MASPGPSKNSPKARGNSSSASYHLTPSEIESLRQDAQRLIKEAKGRFLHLKPKAK